MNTTKLLAIIGIVLGVGALAFAVYLVFNPTTGTFVRYTGPSTIANSTDDQTATVDAPTATTPSGTDTATVRGTPKRIAGPADPGLALGTPVALQLKTKAGAVAVKLQVRPMYYIAESGDKTLLSGLVQNAQGEAAALQALAQSLADSSLPDKDNEQAIDAFETAVREQIAAQYDLKNFEDQLALFLLASSRVLGAPVEVVPAEQYDFVIAPNFAGAITDQAQQEAVAKFVYGVIGRISAPSTR